MTNVNGSLDAFVDTDAGSEQLALLPLPRLRARHPACATCSGGRCHERASQSRQVGRRPSARRGAVRRPDRSHRHDARGAGAAAADGSRHLDRRQRGVQGKRDFGCRSRDGIRSPVDRAQPRNRGASIRSRPGYHSSWTGPWGTTVDPTQFTWTNAYSFAAHRRRRPDRQHGAHHHPAPLCGREPSVERSDAELLELRSRRIRGSLRAVRRTARRRRPLQAAPYYRVTSRVTGVRGTVSYTQVILQ